MGRASARASRGALNTHSVMAPPNEGLLPCAAAMMIAPHLPSVRIPEPTIKMPPSIATNRVANYGLLAVFPRYLGAVVMTKLEEYEPLTSETSPSRTGGLGAVTEALAGALADALSNAVAGASADALAGASADALTDALAGALADAVDALAGASAYALADALALAAKRAARRCAHAVTKGASPAVPLPLLRPALPRGEGRAFLRVGDLGTPAPGVAAILNSSEGVLLVVIGGRPLLGSSHGGEEKRQKEKKGAALEHETPTEANPITSLARPPRIPNDSHP